MSEQSSNSKTLAKWAIWLSVIALILCLFIFALWVFETIPHSVITADSFIGACIALLGVIVTIAVGAQIVNVLEVKSAQRRYEEQLKTALEKLQMQQALIDEEQHRSSHLHNCSFAVIMELNSDYCKAGFYYISALYEGLQAKNAEGNVEFALVHLKECLHKGANHKFSMPTKMKEEIKLIDSLIQKQSNFAWIQSQYEPLRDEYFKKVGL